MTHNEEKLWSLFCSGQLPFFAFQEKYLELTGEAVPDSVGRLGTNMGPITKRRHEYLQKMGREAVARIKARQTDTPPNTSPQHADPEPRG